MTVEEFKLEHLENFEPTNAHKHMPLKQQFEIMKDDPNHHVLSIRKDGIIAIVGVHIFTAGVGEVYTFITDHIYKHNKDFHTTIINLIKYCHRDLKLHRLQMAVEVGFGKGAKWAHSLGFRFEGTMKAYSVDKKDHSLFARIA